MSGLFCPTLPGCYATSIKTRIETYPPPSFGSGSRCCYATSIKTRIETHSITGKTVHRQLVVMLLPLKQGLKHLDIFDDDENDELLCYFH